MKGVTRLYVRSFDHGSCTIPVIISLIKGIWTRGALKGHSVLKGSVNLALLSRKHWDVFLSSTGSVTEEFWKYNSVRSYGLGQGFHEACECGLSAGYMGIPYGR